MSETMTTKQRILQASLYEHIKATKEFMEIGELEKRDRVLKVVNELEVQTTSIRNKTV